MGKPKSKGKPFLERGAIYTTPTGVDCRIVKIAPTTNTVVVQWLGDANTTSTVELKRMRKWLMAGEMIKK